MKTRINLYLPQLRPIKEVLSLKQSVSYVVISLVCCFLTVVSFSYFNDSLNEKQNELTRQLRLEEAHLAEKANELAAVTTTAPLLKDIENIKQKIVEKKKVLAVLETEFEANIGFSSIFDGLSNLTMNNVWLTRIESKEGKLSFGGSALKSQDIPRWVKELEASEVFYGHNFSDLELKREGKVVHFTLHNSNGFVTKEGR